MQFVYRREANRLRHFERAAASQAIATTVVSERERAAMLAINPGIDVRVISNGVDADWFQPRDTVRAGANVVFCGVFDYAPNEQAAVWLVNEVWPLVRTVRPDATLTLVGMNPSDAVRSLAKVGSIEVTGEVADVRPYLWRAAVSVAPLSVARGLQNKVLEALAAGLPCIITPQVADGLPNEVLPGCKTASSSTEFAAAILEVLCLESEASRDLARQASLGGLVWKDRLQPLVQVLLSAQGIQPRDR